MLGTRDGRDGACEIRGGHVVGEGKKGGVACGIGVGVQGQNRRSRCVGVIGPQHCSKACPNLFQNVLDHLEYYDKVWRKSTRLLYHAQPTSLLTMSCQRDYCGGMAWKKYTI